MNQLTAARLYMCLAFLLLVCGWRICAGVAQEASFRLDRALAQTFALNDFHEEAQE